MCIRDRYAAETALDKRGALLAILQANPNEEVKAFALALAASRDATGRQEGLELLKAFPFCLLYTSRCV